MRTVYVCLLLIAGNLACAPNRLSLPEPARSLEGTYQADNVPNTFPIPGQPLQLAIRRITADSVSVTVFAPAQPASSLRFERAYVNQEFGRFSETDGCVGYRIYLTKPSDPSQLSMSCEAPNVFRYFYKIAGSQAQASLDFRKL